MKILIAFELTNPAQTKDQIVEKIKSFGDHLKITSNCYLVISDSDPVTIRNQLKEVCYFNYDNNDILFVADLSKDGKAAWNGLTENTGNWIRAFFQ